MREQQLGGLCSAAPCDHCLHPRHLGVSAGLLLLWELGPPALVAQCAVVLAPKNRAGEVKSCSLVHNFFLPCAPERSPAWRCFCWEFLVFFLLHVALVSTASVPFPRGLCCCLQPLPLSGHSQSLSAPQQFLSPHFRAAPWWSLGALLLVPPFSLQMEQSPPAAHPSSARAVS